MTLITLVQLENDLNCWKDANSILNLNREYSTWTKLLSSMKWSTQIKLLSYSIHFNQRSKWDKKLVLKCTNKQPKWEHLRDKTKRTNTTTKLTPESTRMFKDRARIKRKNGKDSSNTWRGTLQLWCRFLMDLQLTLILNLNLKMPNLLQGQILL